MKSTIWGKVTKATLMGLVLSGCSDTIEKKIEEPTPIVEIVKKEPYLNIHTHFLPNSRFREGIPKVKKFFKNNGINVKFINYKSADNIPKTDHLHNIALIELRQDELIKRRLTKIKKFDEEHKDNLKTKSDEDFNNLIKDLEELLADQIKREATTLGGYADSKRGTAYLIRNPNNHETYQITKDSYKVIKTLTGIMNTTESLEEMNSILDNFKTEASRTIVHEILHITGLVHSFQYEDDKIKDFIKPDFPNVMSYENSSNKGMGFGITPEQKKHIQDYFKGGEPFKDMKKANFDMEIFVKSLDKKYKK